MPPDKISAALPPRLPTCSRASTSRSTRPAWTRGDFVIVVNADKIRVTGGKLDDKIYYRYSGYPGGLNETTLRKQLATHPDRVIQDAVLGMLARNKLRRQLIKKLKVYAGGEHPHTAQQPKPFPLA